MTENPTTLAHTLFGASRGFDPDERTAIVEYLRDAWRAQYRREPSTLSVDLETLDDLFRSHVQAKRLRTAAEELGPIKARRPLLPEAVFVPVDEQRGFVTPEGRVLLDELMRSESAGPTTLSRDDLLSATALIADFYGRRQRQWMHKELSGGNLRPGTLGFILFLLINNSIGQQNSLLLPSSQSEEAALAGRILPVINAFVVGVGGSPAKPRESERLRSNWIITEAKRQMGSDIVRLDQDKTVRFWIEGDRETSVVDELGRHLAKRKGITVASLERTLDRTVEAYDEARPLLTSWGLAHERAAHTRQVREALLTSYATAV
jgi:hypothetical protein